MEPTATAGLADGQDALAGLVHQFADRHAFLRELIQNAIDAGTAEVAVQCEFEAGAGDDGVTTITVTDWGCGMTRAIIEQQLTRLFASSKDGDRTKIGKFGIGFVSVFALDPDAVCVDTAREGERWRLLFGRDHTYDLRTLAEPLEGTRVRVIKAMTREQFAFTQRQVPIVVRHWCRHTQVEIRVDGVVINEPFAVDDAPCQVVHTQDDLVVAVGHPRDRRGSAGYYNTGLTLYVGDQQHLPGLAFKAQSPGLEHTLTRDKVIENRGWRRALEVVARTARDALATRAVTMLGEALATPGSGDLEYLCGAVGWHAADGLGGKLRRRPLFRSPGGAPWSIRDIAGRHRGGEILTAPRRCPLTDALERHGRTVVCVTHPAVAALLRALARTSVAIEPAEHRWCVALPAIGRQDSAAAERLLAATGALLDGCGGRVAAVAFGRPLGLGAGTRIATTEAAAGVPTPAAATTFLGTSWLSRRRRLVLDEDHPLVTALVGLAQDDPSLAAYLLVKAFWLGASLDVRVDGRLSAAAIDAARGAREAAGDG